jgi:hypothetical protein
MFAVGVLCTTLKYNKNRAPERGHSNHIVLIIKVERLVAPAAALLFIGVVLRRGDVSTCSLIIVTIIFKFGNYSTALDKLNCDLYRLLNSIKGNVRLENFGAFDKWLLCGTFGSWDKPAGA